MKKYTQSILAAGFLLLIMGLVVVLLLLSIASNSQRDIIIRQNNFLVCILGVQPQERTQTVITQCREDHL